MILGLCTSPHPKPWCRNHPACPQKKKKSTRTIFYNYIKKWNFLFVFVCCILYSTNATKLCHNITKWKFRFSIFLLFFFFCLQSRRNLLPSFSSHNKNKMQFIIKKKSFSEIFCTWDMWIDRWITVIRDGIFFMIQWT